MIAGTLNFGRRPAVTWSADPLCKLGNYWKASVLVPRVARIEVSGAKLPDDIAANLLKNFELVVDVYGASETNKTFENIVMRDSEGADHSKGAGVLDSEVEIVSATGSTPQGRQKQDWCASKTHIWSMAI